LTKDEIVWAAGVFEATGTATVSGRDAMLNLKQRALVDEAGPPELVARFFAAIGGLGRLGGPYHANGATHPRRHPFVMWWARNADAAVVMERLWPWLGEGKREQWRAVSSATSRRLRLKAPTKGSEEGPRAS
jgi:hypothetical protein